MRYIRRTEELPRTNAWYYVLHPRLLESAVREVYCVTNGKTSNYPPQNFLQQFSCLAEISCVDHDQ